MFHQDRVSLSALTHRRMTSVLYARCIGSPMRPFIRLLETRQHMSSYRPASTASVSDAATPRWAAARPSRFESHRGNRFAGG